MRRIAGSSTGTRRAVTNACRTPSMMRRLSSTDRPARTSTVANATRRRLTAHELGPSHLPTVLSPESDLLPSDHDHAAIRRPTLDTDRLGRRPRDRPDRTLALQPDASCVLRVRPGPQQFAGCRVEEQRRLAVLDIDPNAPASKNFGGGHRVAAQVHAPVAGGRRARPRRSCDRHGFPGRDARTPVAGLLATHPGPLAHPGQRWRTATAAT